MLDFLVAFSYDLSSVRFLSFWYLHGMDLNFILAKSLYASLFELLVEQINKSLLVGKRQAGRSISFPCIRKGLWWICSEGRLHPCTIFVTCSGRLISAQREWLFKEIEAEDDEAHKQHNDDAKKSCRWLGHRPWFERNYLTFLFGFYNARCLTFCVHFGELCWMTTLDGCPWTCWWYLFGDPHWGCPNVLVYESFI